MQAPSMINRRKPGGNFNFFKESGKGQMDEEFADEVVLDQHPQ